MTENTTVYHKGMCLQVEVIKEYIADGVPMALVRAGALPVSFSVLQRDLVVFGGVQTNGSNHKA